MSKSSERVLNIVQSVETGVLQQDTVQTGQEPKVQGVYQEHKNERKKIFNSKCECQFDYSLQALKHFTLSAGLPCG